MENLITRHRNITILVAVLFLQVLGLAVQVKRSTQTEETRLIRVWTVSAVAPFEKALVWTQQSISGAWHNYIYLRGVRAENRGLREQIEKLRIEQARLSEDAEQARRLQILLGFKEKFIARTLAAQVIGSSGSEQSRTVYIDKGAADGVRTDQAVITADGVVGKVIDVYQDHTAKVLLVNDQTSGVGVVLGKSRLQGILKGTPSGGLIVDKILSDESVQPGEVVLTSGGDQIFPKGLPVGVVTKTKISDTFLSITLKPATNLSKLEEVLVVTQVETRAPTLAESGGRVRAADILAERLPSVPPKPAVDTGAKDGAPKIAGSPNAAAPAAQNPKASSTIAIPKPPQQKTVVQAVKPADSAQSASAAPPLNAKPAAAASTNSTKPGNSTVVPTAGGAAKSSLIPKPNNPPPSVTSKPQSAPPPQKRATTAPPEDEPQ
jgi:rod shape-determining protein MreC